MQCRIVALQMHDDLARRRRRCRVERVCATKRQQFRFACVAIDPRAKKALFKLARGATATFSLISPDHLHFADVVVERRTQVKVDAKLILEHEAVPHSGEQTDTAHAVTRQHFREPVRASTSGVCA